MSAVILIVDDDRSIRTSMSRLLSACGYTACAASTAAQALQKACEIHPEVILMDLHMPPTSGIDAARELKRHPDLKHIPIIAISATPPTLSERPELFAAILIKPCPCTQMTQAIEDVMRR